MSEQSSSDVRPLSPWRLLALTVGTFLVALLILEAADPRLTGPLRTPARPPATVVGVPKAAASPARGRLPTARPSPATERPFGAPEAANLFSGFAMVVETEGQGARLRSGPAAQANVLAVLDEGTTVQLTGQETEADDRLWVEVHAPGGLSGWVAADFLTPLEPTPAP